MLAVCVTQGSQKPAETCAPPLSSTPGEPWEAERGNAQQQIDGTTGSVAGAYVNWVWLALWL